MIEAWLVLVAACFLVLAVLIPMNVRHGGLERLLSIVGSVLGLSVSIGFVGLAVLIWSAKRHTT